MKSHRAFFVALCTLIGSCTPLAHAKPVGTLTCTGSTGQVKFNISYFTFGITAPTDIGSGSSGAGAGKVTFQPLEIHAALSTFSTLAVPASNGENFQTCNLTSTFNDGSQTQFEFKLVLISSLTAAASMPAQPNEPARYTDVKFAYGAVEVKSSSGADDGGTGGIPPGWNVIQNQNQ